MSATTSWLGSPELAQLGFSRVADAGDAVGGVAPRIVLEPTTPEGVAAALAWASRERLAVVIRGRGTKLGWGRSPAALDVVLAMNRLNRVLAHRHGDLTATVQGGATLADVNRQLAREGQWLPLDSAFDAATVGGLVATNDAGPLRHRYGTPRDLLIGMTIAMTDGRVVKSGGHVVKNVAGYDLGKLVSGSFGTLAAIVDATFKLSPLLPASRTLALRYADADTLAADVSRLSESQLEPAGVDVQVSLGARAEHAPVRRLFVRFATSPGATTAQTEAAGRLLQGHADVLGDEQEAALWAEQVRRPWGRGGAVIRCSWLPASLPYVLALLDEVHRVSEGSVELTARAVVGTGLLRVDADEGGVRAAIERLRSRSSLVSNVVVLQQPAAGDGAIDVWGPPASAAGVLRAIKRTFDPAGILNAGRGPV